MGITGTADTTGEAGTVAAVSIAAPGVVVGTAARGTNPDEETLLSPLRSPVASRTSKAHRHYLALAVSGPRQAKRHGYIRHPRSCVTDRNCDVEFSHPKPFGPLPDVVIVSDVDPFADWLLRLSLQFEHCLYSPIRPRVLRDTTWLKRLWYRVLKVSVTMSGVALPAPVFRTVPQPTVQLRNITRPLLDSLWLIVSGSRDSAGALSARLPGRGWLSPVVEVW
jgi:hypothetical protein